MENLYNKKLSDEEVADFVQRAAVQLNAALTRQLLSIVTELLEWRRSTKFINNKDGEKKEEDTAL